MASTISPPTTQQMGNYPPSIAEKLVAGLTAAKTDVDALQAPAGAALANADATITVADGRWRTLPAATLSANRTITLGTAGAVEGDRIEITRLDAGAFTLAIVNGGAGAGTLVTHPISKVGSSLFQFDGTDWKLRSVGTL